MLKGNALRLYVKWVSLKVNSNGKCVCVRVCV